MFADGRNLTFKCSATLLAKIAVEDEDYDVRRAATWKLTDQALLAKVAVESKDDGGVRWVAVEKLTDQALLAKIAVEDEDYDVRRAAVEKLTDLAVFHRSQDLTSQIDMEAIRRAAQARPGSVRAPVSRQ